MRSLYFLPVLFLAIAAHGGTIVTTDGETFEGDLKRVDDGWSVTDDQGGVKTVAVRKVKSIELSSSPTAGDRSTSALASLRRSVEFSDDLPKIVQRYQTFIAQTKDAATATQAKEDLAVWQDRQTRGLVKVGRQWMTTDDREAALRQSRAQAEQARLLIKAGRDEAADRLIATTLDADPNQVSALYLRGVLETKRGDTAAARKSFTAVEQALPQHAPTLLNLSLILLRQKQWGPACASLDQALAAAPVARVLLDTAAEFINALPPEQRKIAAAQKLAKRFFDQDARLQKLMAGRQMYRWGGSWIGQAEFDKIHKAQDDVRDKINGLEADFAKTDQSVGQIDRQIADNERSLHDIEAHSYVVAADGTTLRVPYPRAYYDLQSQIVQLRTERGEASLKLESLRTQARDAQKTMPVPTYTGVLTPVDEDGVPLTGPADPPAPATAPSTAPSSEIRVGPP